MDAWLQRKFPNTSPARLAILGTTVVCLALSYPVFLKPKTRQGEDLFSQERPEFIQAHKEQLQKEYRKARDGKDNNK